VSVIYRHYPGHEFSVAAAIAAECAARSVRFEAMHDLLYAQAESIGKRPWARFAAEAGVSDTVAFSRCVRQRSTIDAIARDTLAATALGVDGTPTFLINDLAVVGYNEQQLTGYVDAAVTRARTGK
jgi:protein-disulfide isomerase